MNDFGVIIACHRGDFFLAKGCCASVRYFMENVPICLIIDGTFSPEPLERGYGVIVLNHDNVQNEFLRRSSFGSRSAGRTNTKLIALWESPFDTFLYMDADAVVWGDVREHAVFNEGDAIVDQPLYEHSDEAIGRYFFDGEAMERYFPGFQWRRRPFFCAGTFYARRGIIPLDEYRKVLEFHETHPWVFKCGDQGFTNFMLFRAADEGRIRLMSRDYQVIVPDYVPATLSARFRIESGRPVCEESAKVIHWPGHQKPFFDAVGFVSPMTFFRQKCVLDTGNSNDPVQALRLLHEEDESVKRERGPSLLARIRRKGLAWLLRSWALSSC
jgi:hypothetical protein